MKTVEPSEPSIEDEPSEEDIKQWEREQEHLAREKRLIFACLLYGALFPLFCFYLIKLAIFAWAHGDDATGINWIVYNWVATLLLISFGVAIPWISWNRFVKPHRRHFFQSLPPPNELISVPEIICIALLLWALIPANPYEYYILLRWVVCGVSLYVAVKARQQKKVWWTCVLCAVAILFNPLIPLEATRSVWIVADLLTAIMFATFRMEGYSSTKPPVP